MESAWPTLPRPPPPPEALLCRLRPAGVKLSRRGLYKLIHSKGGAARRGTERVGDPGDRAAPRWLDKMSPIRPREPIGPAPAAAAAAAADRPGAFYGAEPVSVTVAGCRHASAADLRHRATVTTDQTSPDRQPSEHRARPRPSPAASGLVVAKEKGPRAAEEGSR